MTPPITAAYAAATIAGTTASLLCTTRKTSGLASGPETDRPARHSSGLDEAQALVETLRPLANMFQVACQQSKATCRELRSHSSKPAEDPALISASKQYWALIRNRDSCLRLLQALRKLMDIMLGVDPAEMSEDSWSDSSNEGLGDIDDGGALSRATVARLKAIRQETSLLVLRAGRLPPAPQDSEMSDLGACTRQQNLAAEKESLSAAASQPPLGSDTESIRLLTLVVDHLRQIEVDHSFQSSLAVAHRRLGATTDYSRENFAYGSTPFSSWLKLHTDGGGDALASAVNACSLSSGPHCSEYVVFGSSLGWLCFYAGFALGVRAVGYDLVEPAVELAQTLASQHCIPGRHDVTFYCKDMLSAPLNRCGIWTLPKSIF